MTNILSPEEYETIINLDNISLQSYLNSRSWSHEELQSISLTEAFVRGEEAKLALKITALDLPFYPGVFVVNNFYLWQREFEGELLSAAIAKMSLEEFKHALDGFVAGLQMIDKTLGLGFAKLQLSDILVTNNAFYLASHIVIDPNPFYDFKEFISTIASRSFANNEVKDFCRIVIEKITHLSRSESLDRYLYLRFTDQI